eukprot:566380-Lingulodinium_polyedra.AAC.1
MLPIANRESQRLPIAAPSRRGNGCFVPSVSRLQSQTPVALRGTSMAYANTRHPIANDCNRRSTGGI